MNVAVAMAVAVLLASPWLAHRALASRVAPRPLAFAYLAGMLADAGAVVMALAALVVRLAPHSVARVLGIGCLRATSCSTTLPGWLQTGLWLVSLLALLLVLVRIVSRLCAGVMATRRAGHWVQAQRRADPSLCGPILAGARHVVVLDLDEPLAFTVGLFSPRIVLSRGLVARVPAPELEAVLAHEAAHRRYRDNVGLLVTRALGGRAARVPVLRRTADRFGRAVELAADEAARRRTGDALLVAESVCHVARLVSGERGWAGQGNLAAGLVSGFVPQGRVTERIHALTGRRARPSGARFAGAILAFALALSVSSGGLLALSDLSPALGSSSRVCASMVVGPR
jgi:Zn-dependent protease with chaperone function